MESFQAWFERTVEPSKPWLVLGKGPSFVGTHQYDANEFNVLGLNHVGREHPVDVAHVIDMDVIDQCGIQLEKNAQHLVMPWHPHVDNLPSSRTLEEFAAENGVLSRLNAEGRLLFYNHSLAKRHHPDSAVITVRYFGSVGAINLLVSCGARVIRTLGIDGGTQYSRQFSDLKDKTLLANSRSSFDAQFVEFAKTIMNTGIDLAPLDIQSPIKVFVATTEAQMLAVKVLEYSIKKHASMSTEVVPLHRVGIEIPMPAAQMNHPRTPFSFQRFLIPQACGYKGRAIYLDSDMQVFKDVKALWTLPFSGANLLAAREPGESGRKPQFSVMLLDCETLDWDISSIVRQLDEGTLNYEELMYEMKVADSVAADIDPAWNSLERYEEGLTSLLHYTDMNTQPWVSQKNPLGYLWFRDLFEAIDRGYVSEQEIRSHIEKGWLRPSLWYQVEHRIEDAFLLPRKARQLDARYRAPYTNIHAHGASPWRNLAYITKAMIRRILQKTPYYELKAKVRDRIYR